MSNKAKTPRTSADELLEFENLEAQYHESNRHRGIVPSPVVIAPDAPLPQIGVAPPLSASRPTASRPNASRDPDTKAKIGGKGRKTRKCKNDSTFVWLNVWYKNDFEKLGWMILAKNNGDHVKVEAYKNSVKRLYYQLDCKIKDTKDHDRKQDLMIMLKNVKCLLTHIHKDF